MFNSPKANKLVAEFLKHASTSLSQLWIILATFTHFICVYLHL